MGSRGRYAVFAVLTVAVVLGGLEAGLRVVRPAAPELVSPLPFQRIAPDTITDGPVFGTRAYYVGRHEIARVEPVGHRIFVFGGSAAYGEKMTPYGAFGGWIQRYLRVIEPQETWEVVNLAGGGLAIRHVAELMEHLLEVERPSMLVVYCGNNEFHELRALKELSPDFDAAWELARRRLSTLYLYRSLRALLVTSRVQPPEGRRMVPTITDIHAEVDEDDRRLVEQLYRESLRRIVRLAREADVPVLLTTVADNLREAYAQWGDDKLEEDEVGLIQTLEAMRAQAAPDEVLEWVEANDMALQSEAAQGRVGQALLAKGLRKEARAHFERSEYLARKPFRANVALRRAVLEVARDTGAPFCDTEHSLSMIAHARIPGYDLFMDSCHPNPRAHRHLAQTMLRCAVQQGLLPLSGDKEAQMARLAETIASIPLHGQNPFRVDEWTGAIEDPRVLSWGPFEVRDGGTARDLAVAGHHYFMMNRHDEALVRYSRSLEAGGDRAGLQLSRGLALTRLGRWEEAREALREAASLLPGDVAVRQFLAVMGPEGG